MYTKEYEPEENGNNSRYRARETRENLQGREDYGPACHKCAKQAPEVDLVECGDLRCDRHVCSECATECEFEMEACADHAYSVFCDIRDMYRNGLRSRRGSYARFAVKEAA